MNSPRHKVALILAYALLLFTFGTIAKVLLMEGPIASKNADNLFDIFSVLLGGLIGYVHGHSGDSK